MKKINKVLTEDEWKIENLITFIQDNKIEILKELTLDKDSTILLMEHWMYKGGYPNTPKQVIENILKDNYVITSLKSLILK